MLVVNVRSDAPGSRRSEVKTSPTVAPCTSSSGIELAPIFSAYDANRRTVTVIARKKALPNNSDRKTKRLDARCIEPFIHRRKSLRLRQFLHIVIVEIRYLEAGDHRAQLF